MNGKKWWVITSTAIAAGMLLLGAWSGWQARDSRIESDGAFRARVEQDMVEGKARAVTLAQQGEKLSDLHAAVMVNNQQIANLQDLVHQLADQQGRLADKIDLLVQAQMREGRIAR